MGQFGDEFRRVREGAGKSMTKTARAIGISAPYLSDIERGQRAPLDHRKIVAAAQFMGVDPDTLLELAARERGHIEIITTTAMQQRVGAALARRFPVMNEEELDRLAQMLEGEQDNDS